MGDIYIAPNGKFKFELINGFIIIYLNEGKKIIIPESIYMYILTEYFKKFKTKNIQNKTCKRFSNSSHVTLPKNWTRKLVMCLIIE